MRESSLHVLDAYSYLISVCPFFIVHFEILRNVTSDESHFSFFVYVYPIPIMNYFAKEFFHQNMTCIF